MKVQKIAGIERTLGGSNQRINKAPNLRKQCQIILKKTETENDNQE